MKGEEEPSPCIEIATTTFFFPFKVNTSYQKVNAMDFGHGFLCVCK
jgi:hypothetical protein